MYSRYEYYQSGVSTSSPCWVLNTLLHHPLFYNPPRTFDVRVENRRNMIHINFYDSNYAFIMESMRWCVFSAFFFSLCYLVSYSNCYYYRNSLSLTCTLTVKYSIKIGVVYVNLDVCSIIQLYCSVNCYADHGY